MKDTILAAAIEEVTLRGLRFTMQDLATRLRVSKRSIYENFSSKEELVRYMVDAILTDMSTQEQAILEAKTSCINRLEQLLTVHPYEAEMFNKNIYEDLRRFFPKQWQKVEAARQLRLQRIEQLLEAGITARELRPVNVGLISEVIKCSFDSFTSYHFLEQNKLTYKEAMESLLSIMLEGIAIK